jgi:hypothetical protein
MSVDLFGSGRGASRRLRRGDELSSPLGDSIPRRPRSGSAAAVLAGQSSQISAPISAQVVPKRPRSTAAPEPAALTDADEARIAAAMRVNTNGRDTVQRIVIPQQPRPTTEEGKKAQEPFWNEVVRRLNVSNDVSDGCIQEPVTLDCLVNSDEDPTFRLNDYLYNKSTLRHMRAPIRDPMTRAPVPEAAWRVAFPPEAAPAAQPGPAPAGQPVSAANAAIGMRVVRGPDWFDDELERWFFDEDGGAGGRGTIVLIERRGLHVIVWVQWDEDWEDDDEDAGEEASAYHVGPGHGAYLNVAPP